METLGQRLKALRVGIGKSQEAVASDLEMTQGMISSFEKDKGDPSLSTIRKLAAYYQVKLSSLLDGEEIEYEGLSGQRLAAIALILGASEGKIRSVLTILRARSSADDKSESSVG